MIMIILRCGTNASSVQLLSMAKQIVNGESCARTRTHAPNTDYGVAEAGGSVVYLTCCSFTLVIVVFKNNIIMTYCRVIRAVRFS